MNKKTYITPIADALDLALAGIICTSAKEGDNAKNNDYITDPDQLGAKETETDFWNNDEE